MLSGQSQPRSAPLATRRRLTLPWRKALAFLEVAVVLSVFVVWFFEFRPQMLGGPAQYVVVAGTSMAPSLKTGDVVVVRAHSTYDAGDVIAYRVPKGAPAAGGRIIHRIVGGTGASGYVVKGDNRTTADLWHPRDADVIGSVSLRLPQAARIALFLRSPLVIASLAAGLIFAFVVGGRRRDEREERFKPPRP